MRPQIRPRLRYVAGALILAGGASVGAVIALSGPVAHAATTYYVNESSLTTVGSDSQNSASVDCNTGDVATGGGVLQNYDTEASPDMVVIQDFPVESGGSAFGWRGDYYNSDSTSHEFVTYVDCVSTS
jgi:hypothetical protein